MRKSFVKRLVLPAVLAVGLGIWSPPGAEAASGRVQLSTKEIAASNASAGDQRDLLQVLSGFWDRYLHQDVPGTTAHLAQDVTRLSQRAGVLQQGLAAVAAGLPAEWEAFERPRDVIAERMRVRRLEIVVDQPAAATATLTYWMEIRGGARWKYTDVGLVFQALEKIDGRWKIAHQTDSWSLDYDPRRLQRGSETFEFDFVYPVADLSRAAGFYSAILGDPEWTDSDRASFNLQGARFVLDRTRLGGQVTLSQGLPTGYAVFYVPDVAAERDRLRNSGTTFIAGTANSLLSDGEDRYAIGLDPSRNVFVLKQRQLVSDEAGTAPALSGLDGSDPSLVVARSIADAWLRMDTGSISGLQATGARWFDDRRTRVRGMEDAADLPEVLEEVYWSGYDRSPSGLAADLEASSPKVRSMGSRTIVSYAMTLTGRGAHPFRETAFVTHLLDGASSVAATFLVADNTNDGAMGLSLDYTGYPVTSLSEAERFYTRTMRLGDPYPDSAYRGYWSAFSVFGIYVADRPTDGLPRNRESNGYVSFWVDSADDVHDYLVGQGSSFPHIPAINDGPGIDEQPGYRQVLATDSEGSAVLFTEYPGR